METTTNNVTMYFDADEVLSGAKPLEKREAVVQKAIEFAISQGCKPEDAAKLRNALIGSLNENGTTTPGALALVTWKIHMCNIDALVAARNEIWQPMSGKMPVVSRYGQQSYAIVQRANSESDPNITFGIAIQKKGSAAVDQLTGEVKEPPYFWTYAAVCVQTAERTSSQGTALTAAQQLPLVLAFDVNAAPDATGRDKILSGEWSRRLYIARRENPYTHAIETENRLSGLIRGSNDEMTFLHALLDAGFPVHTARINRRPANQNSQWQPRGRQQPEPARSLVGAGVGNSLGAPETDFFGENG